MFEFSNILDEMSSINLRATRFSSGNAYYQHKSWSHFAQAQARYLLPRDKVALYDLVQILPVHPGIPHSLRVYYHYRPPGTAVKAACLVDAYHASTMNSQRLAALFHIIPGILRSMHSTILTFGALIGAYKHMMLEIGHSLFPGGNSGMLIIPAGSLH